MRRIDRIDASALAVASDPLTPVRAALSAAFPAGTPAGIAPGLTVTAGPDWIGAQDLVDGTRVRELLAAVGQLRGAAPHAAAALAWKAYTYALALPAVVGWAAAGRVPLVRPELVLVRLRPPGAVLQIGLLPSISVAVLPMDPLASAGRPDVEVVADEAALLTAFRAALFEAHLGPMLDRIRATVRAGSRPFLGSLASGVAHALVDAERGLPGSPVEYAERLLDVLGIADLVDLVPMAQGGLSVQRHTCCLAFTLPEPKICPGCCIRRGRPVGSASPHA